jgi:hypothetical protein
MITTDPKSTPYFYTNAEAIGIASGPHRVQCSCMGKTKRKIETIYMDHEKFERLKLLARMTRIPRAVLWREALDDLLTKHGVPQENQHNS